MIEELLPYGEDVSLIKAALIIFLYSIDQITTCKMKCILKHL